MTNTQVIKPRILGMSGVILRFVPKTFTASQFITAFEKLDHSGYEMALWNANSYQDFNKWVGKHILPELEDNNLIRRTGREADVITENGYTSPNTEWEVL